jgi:hypothetical protein
LWLIHPAFFSVFQLNSGYFILIQPIAKIMNCDAIVYGSVRAGCFASSFAPWRHCGFALNPARNQPATLETEAEPPLPQPRATPMTPYFSVIQLISGYFSVSGKNCSRRIWTLFLKR